MNAPAAPSAAAVGGVGEARTGAEILLGFARTLRAAGVGVTADRERAFLEASAALGMHHPAGVYHAGRATLCGGPADLERFDLVFDAYFRGELGGRKSQQVPPTVTLSQDDLDQGAGGEREVDPDVVRAAASAQELLRHKDVATLTPEEKRRLDGLFAGLRPRPPLRRAHRHRRSARGPVDARATLRDSLRRLGEPGVIAHRRRDLRARRVVLLIDISGSMSAYADALLRLAHRLAVTGMPLEAFTLGTRLTHISRPLHHRDADRALVAVGAAIPDYSGGTRLADNLKLFLDRWGRRGMARGAVVVIVSDGWERGEPAALGEQVRRLRRVAHCVIWANPHRGNPRYQPVQAGIVAVMPHLDHFVAGHSMAAFAELLEVIADA